MWERGEAHELWELPVVKDVLVPLHRNLDLDVIRVGAPGLDVLHQVQHPLHDSEQEKHAVLFTLCTLFFVYLEIVVVDIVSCLPEWNSKFQNVKHKIPIHFIWKLTWGCRRTWAPQRGSCPRPRPRNLHTEWENILDFMVSQNILLSLTSYPMYLEETRFVGTRKLWKWKKVREKNC